MTQAEFEKLLVAEFLCATRNRAQMTSRFIKANLQGRSAEAYAKLVPDMMKAGIAPSTSIAKTIVVLAMDWQIGN